MIYCHLFFLSQNNNFQIANGFITIVALVIAYKMGKSYDLLSFHSERDPLTMLYNRRFVERSFDRVASLALRNKMKLFVMIVDCDDFKNINDLHGHQKGDDVLRAIGMSLNKSMRKSDIVTRWGGDEFVIIGQLKNEEGIDNLCLRLHRDFSVLSENLHIPVSVSIGYAIFPDHHDKLEKLLHFADINMYQEKMIRDKEKELSING